MRLVTPPELGRTADMVFEGGNDLAVVSSDGEHFALRALTAFVEPGVSDTGTDAVFSRAPAGWTMQSAATPGMAAETLEMRLLSPEFAQVALFSRGTLHPTNELFRTGPVGGPYATLSVPEIGRTTLLGANDGTPGVAPFSDVVFESQDHALLPPGPERDVAEETEPESHNLYEWTSGRLQLVNVEGEGSHVRLINLCGATLGSGYIPGNAINAVSADGSRVFFTSPEDPQLSGCPEPQLYMRINGRETVDVSEPQGLSVPLLERGKVSYDGASPDGSRVFFTAEDPLTPGGGSGPFLYEYDAEAEVGQRQRLRLIANEAGTVKPEYTNPEFGVVSEDGSAVYYRGTHDGIVGIWRYDTATGKDSFVAEPSETTVVDEPWYTTPDGGFLVFPSGVKGVRVAGPHGLPELGPPEPRGLHHNELYRYDAASGGVVCVSCGEGVVPTKGQMLEPDHSEGILETPDSSRSPISISEDGRRVFFQTSAQLVPQDKNEDTPKEEAEPVITGLGGAADVYEWEQEATEEAPGVFCGVTNGCTHLISAGEEVGPEHFLGASANGDNVFFSSTAQLVSQATPEFTNIYDARVEGGFPPPPPRVECTSCQGVGGPPLQLTTPASETLAGAENPAGPIIVEPKLGGNKPKPAPKCKHGFKRNKHGRCVRSVSRRRGRRS